MSNLNKFGITEAQMLVLANQHAIQYRFANDDMRDLLAYSQALLALAATASPAAPSGEPVFPLSVLDAIAQEHADGIPGPGGYPCSTYEKESFKKAFLKRWMPKAAIANQPPKAALTNDRILEMRDSVWCAVAGDDEYDAADLAFARAIEAATVPKAKLEALELLSKFWLGRHFDSVNQSEADGINAALASAGVPLKGE